MYVSDGMVAAGERYIAAYDYTGREHTELSFNAGDVILIHVKSDVCQALHSSMPCAYRS